VVKVSFFSGAKLNREQRKKLNEELPYALLRGEHKSLMRKYDITPSTRAYNKIQKVAEKINEVKADYGRKKAQSFIDAIAGKKKSLNELWPEYKWEYTKKIMKLTGVPKKKYEQYGVELKETARSNFLDEIHAELKKAELNSLGLDAREALLKKKLESGGVPIKTLHDLVRYNLTWFGRFKDKNLNQLIDRLK
jgi:hypothetical protein